MIQIYCLTIRILSSSKSFAPAKICSQRTFHAAAVCDINVIQLVHWLYISGGSILYIDVSSDFSHFPILEQNNMFLQSFKLSLKNYHKRMSSVSRSELIPHEPSWFCRPQNGVICDEWHVLRSIKMFYYCTDYLAVENEYCYDYRKASRYMNFKITVLLSLCIFATVMLRDQ